MLQSTKDNKNKELETCLYSSDENIKKRAIYRILFDRRIELLPVLKKAANSEKNEQLAVFMVQVCLTLSSFPRDSEIERRILKIIQNEEKGKLNNLTPNMWKYLENTANSQMIIAILDSMGNTVPPNSYDFIEMCLTHPDPDVRTMVCEKAIKSGRPSHFAYVLKLITDKDPIVAETAFLAVKNLPESDLSIILDYSLGSPDEWVLNTVAPFLPKLINKNLRPIISKNQYHSNSNISHKAREALKLLDSIHSTKIMKKAIKEEPQEKTAAIEPVKTISFKERLEQKRKEQDEIERKKREEEEALNREIFSVNKYEMEEFRKVMTKYDLDSSKDEANHKADLNESLFSEESNILAKIDDKEFSDDFLNFKDDKENKKNKSSAKNQLKYDISSILEDKHETNINLDTETKPNEDTSSSQKEKIKISNSELIDKSKSNIKETEIELKYNSKSVTKKESNQENKEQSELTIDKESNSLSDLNFNFENETTESFNFDETEDFLNTESLSIENMDLSSTYESEINLDKNNLENIESDNSLQDIEDIKVDEMDLSAIDFAYVAESMNQPPKEEYLKNEENTISNENTESIINQATLDNNNQITPNNQLNNDSNNKPLEQKDLNHSNNSKDKNIQNEVKPIKPAVTIKISIPSNIKSIIDKYPSFLVDPLLDVYKNSDYQLKLKAIDNVLTNLTAFLNICFLQSALFYAQESEMLTKSIKDCIKGNLIGPSSIRCLHNFVLAMKVVRGNNVFFTFPLSKIMATPIETNPLMLMRELREYLRDPQEPLNETVPQAVDGLIEILKGISSITMNTLVMRAPRGAKLPYADLSGPIAKVLAKEKRPSIDLPVGEVVLISTNGAEAFGLYPFFKYEKKKITFSIPSQKELAVFYERLEITQ